MSGIYKHLGGGHRGLDSTLKVDETNALVESVMGANPGERLHNKTIAEGKRQLAVEADDDEADTGAGNWQQAREHFWQDIAGRIRKYMKRDDWYQDDDGLKFLKLLAMSMMDIGNGDLRTAHDNLLQATKWVDKFAKSLESTSESRERGSVSEAVAPEITGAMQAAVTNTNARPDLSRAFRRYVSFRQSGQGGPYEAIKAVVTKEKLSPEDEAILVLKTVYGKDNANERFALYYKDPSKFNNRLGG